MMTTIRSRNLSVFFIGMVLVLPFVAHGQIVTEIMYDLPGADTGHEWIEVWNNGTTDNPLTQWKLFEGTTNHKITGSKGTGTLSIGAYAVIADNAATFLADHPSYTGSLFDSAFSLSNDGETLILRDAKLADVTSISYTPSLGANGDGNSLQRTSSNVTFVPGTPTPGKGDIGTLIVPAKKIVTTSATKTAKKIAIKTSTTKKTNPSPTVISDNSEEAPSGNVIPLNPSAEVAAVAAAPGTNLMPWVLGLMLFLGVAVVAILGLRQQAASSWKIVEDTSDTV